MALGDQFRAAAEAGDLETLRRLWAHACPHLPPLPAGETARMVLHHARTQMASLPLKARAWSHRWLLDHGFPSGLPDALKPKAERLYPQVVSAVGICVRPRTEAARPAALEIRGAMEDAVSDAYAEGRTDPAFVAARMREARAKVTRQLFG